MNKLTTCVLALVFALGALAQTPTLVYEARDYTRARVNPSEPWTTATTGTVAQLNVNAGDEVEHRWTATGVTYCAGSWRSLFLAINSTDYSMPAATTDSVLSCGVGPTPSITRIIRIVVGNATSGVFPLVQFPNGGEILTAGQTVNILWTVTGNPTSQTVRFSGNGGASWLDIATVPGNSRSYAWTVPNVAAAQGLIRITATDGITTSSDDSNAFFTIRTGIDTTPPNVNFVSPQSGQTVSGTITISANATDNVVIAGVQFVLDGTNLGPELIQPPYQIGWNTASSANGTHTLTARARDTSGYTNSASVTVIVNNAGAVTFQILIPAAGAFYPAGQQLNITWQQAGGATGYDVYFAADGANFTKLNAYLLRSTDSSLGWTPIAATTAGKIRVFAQLGNTQAMAESGYFTITGAAPPATPQFTANDVTSAATGDIRGVLAGGGLFSIFGQNLSAVQTRATTFPLPTRLADTEVLVNGSTVPLLFVSPGQINFQAPNPLAGKTATVQVANRASGLTSQVVNLTVVAYAPALFPYLDQGVSRVIVQNHATSGLVTWSSPLSLALGRFMVLYGTGFGPTEATVASGEPAPATRLLDGANTAFIIDGHPRPSGAVEYVGLAPGMAGVFQVNLEIPAGLAPGEHSGVIVINGRTMPFQFWTAN